MVKFLFENEKDFSKKFEKLLEKRGSYDSDISDIVEKILTNIKNKSDKALLEYTKKYDNNRVKSFNDLIVKNDEIESAYLKIDKKIIKSLKHSIKRIKSYHQKQLPKNDIYKDKHGILLGGIWNPIDSVCLYVPGGKAAYPSSLIMNAVPAIVSGVKRIVMTVPAINGVVNDLVLACAKLLGIKEIYKIGGAQAIGALAFGTKNIEKVDKIVGPGNAYVATAKKKVFGNVGIDMIAGPSEILVIADNKNNPNHIAIDLLSQAEHDELAQSILITNDHKFATEVNKSVDYFLKEIERKEIAKKSWKKFGAIVVCKNLKSCINYSNKIAPEHLEIAVEGSKKYLKYIKNAGAIFLGRYTPEAIGDYIAGPNHVLPTDRTAKFSSGLNVLDFFKRTSIVSCNKKNINEIGKDAIVLANEEGLQAHALSIECRLNNN
ncbi:MAG: histidinol dehydrogenase [Alphaproteobacteria bacterium]|jgi:histidinol dehydrogenase|tara:strand:+ start:823 stop:2121 length:1299 start_codon:yes stop_codon:yes gene_type:complete